MPGHLTNRYLLTACTCLFLTLPGLSPHGSAHAAASSSWRIVGQSGGPVQGIAAQEDTVYAGVGPRLVTFDASNPAGMRAIGGTQAFGDFVKGVAVAGRTAYVAAGVAGLRVVDVGDPAKPVEIGAWDSPGYASGIAVSGSTAYLADGPCGLVIIDVSDPKQPKPIGSAYSAEYAYGAAVSGKYVYIAAGSAGLLAADVGDPAHPVETGSLDTAGFAYGVAADGASAFVADGWNGLQVVDVTNPADPAPGALLAMPGWAFGVTLSNGTAYVADAQGGLRVVDVSNPLQPRDLGAIAPAAGHAGSVAVSGNSAFVADRSGGVRAIDVSNPSGLAEVGLYSPLGNAVRVVTDGKYAYVAAGNFGLKILDVSDPSRPREAGWYDAKGYIGGVDVVGDYAYLSDQFNQAGGCGMHVVDISNPDAPVLAAYYLSPFPNGAYRDIEVADGIAYLVDELSLQLVDVSDPRHPTPLSRFIMMEKDGEETTGVAVRGKTAYVASSFAGLKTVDVSDPANPKLLGRSTTEYSSAQDVFVAGDIAYVAESNILRTVDVSDPARQKTLGMVFTPGELFDVVVEGSTAYLAVSGRGLETADVSDPSGPVLLGGYDTAGIAHGITVGGGNVYLADGQNGLVILAPGSGMGTTVEDRNAEPGFPFHASSPARIPSGFPAENPQNPYELRDSVFMAPDRESYALESDRAASSLRCTVTSAADSGPGSLRDCLENAGTGASIDFSPGVFPPENPATIRLRTSLPHLPGNTTLDGSNAGVIIDGSDYDGENFGISLTSDGNIVRGLQLTGFPNPPILVMGRNNIIGGDRSIGDGPTGQGNLISGNRDMGIFVAGPDASGNLIVGNLIGTDVTGKVARGNGNHGVFLHGGAHDNTVGGLEEWKRNIISDNYYAGVSMMGQGTSHNRVIGNYVGTDISGTKALGNRGNGITMELAASGNIIQRNLSSGNTDVGVGISDQGSDYNIVIGNWIGTDAGGTRAIPNGGGVRVGFGGASFNRIGGTEPGEGNLISGNRTGVNIVGANTVGNLLLGNWIGVDASGAGRLGNTGTETLVISAGETVVEGNIVAGNDGTGIILDSGSTPSFVLGNRVGLSPVGDNPLGNAGNGIELLSTDSNFIQGNTVANNRGSGIRVEVGSRNTIRRNAVYSNVGGIVLIGAGNANLAAPVFSADPEKGVSGTTCAGCTVELFADAGGQGRYYLDSRTADATGAFTFAFPCLPAGLSLTATVTDPDGNTSAFSAPVSVPGVCMSLR